MDFSFVSLRIMLCLTSDVACPYQLFTLKSAFETAFRHAAGCPYSGADAGQATCGCLYHRTFSQALSCDPDALRRFQKPALPFMFSLPILPPAPNRGARIVVGLTLVGNAAQDIPAYLAALRFLFDPENRATPVKATITGVETCDYSGNGTSIMEADGSSVDDRVTVLSFQGLQQQGFLPSGAITLRLVTPLRLLHEGRPLRLLTFPQFIRPLMRRVSSLAYYYGGVEMTADFKWLARASDKVTSDATDLNWITAEKAASGIRWAGLTGRMVFRGDLNDYQPFLLFGEFVHVGKEASFGLGRYVIENAG